MICPGQGGFHTACPSSSPVVGDPFSAAQSSAITGGAALLFILGLIVLMALFTMYLVHATES